MNSFPIPFITQTQEDLSHIETEDGVNDDDDSCFLKREVCNRNLPSQVIVRQHTRKKPKSSNSKKTFLMTDVRSHKAIVNIGKAANDEFKNNLMRNSNNTTSPQTIASKRAWSIFFANKTKKKRKKPNFVCVAKAKQAIKSRKKFLTAINDLSKPMRRKTWEYYSPDMDP